MTCAIIKCTLATKESRAFFLGTFESLAEFLGPNPGVDALGSALDRLAAIFASIALPPRRSVTGLVGELVFIAACGDPRAAVDAWRVASRDRFDFMFDGFRVDVKATSSRKRVHVVSFEQTNPPAGGNTILASMFVELVSHGMSGQQLMEEILSRCSGDLEAELKVREHIATEMGENLPSFMDSIFDSALAFDSLSYFDATRVPAIRGELPQGVSAVKFASDFSQSDRIDLPAIRLGES